MVGITRILLRRVRFIKFNELYHLFVTPLHSVGTKKSGWHWMKVSVPRYYIVFGGILRDDTMFPATFIALARIFAVARQCSLSARRDAVWRRYAARRAHAPCAACEALQSRVTHAAVQPTVWHTPLYSPHSAHRTLRPPADETCDTCDPCDTCDTCDPCDTCDTSHMALTIWLSAVAGDTDSDGKQQSSESIRSDVIYNH